MILYGINRYRYSSVEILRDISDIEMIYFEIGKVRVRYVDDEIF